MRSQGRTGVAVAGAQTSPVGYSSGQDVTGLGQGKPLRAMVGRGTQDMSLEQPGQEHDMQDTPAKSL